MSHVLANLTAQASTYAGMLGTVPLDGVALVNHRTFDADSHIADGSTVRVAVFDKATGDSEIMVATYATAGPSLTRTATVLALGPNSTTPTTPCDFQAGPKEVHLVRDAAQDSVTPGAGLTPRALASGKIADGWLDLKPLPVSDFLVGGYVGLHLTATTAIFPFSGAVVTGGSAVVVDGGDLFGVALALRSSPSSSANSGYSIGIVSDIDAIGALRYQRTTLQTKNIAGLRLLVGWTNAGATDGAHFFFVGTDVIARFGTETTATTYTLSDDVVYNFEVEVNAAGTACTFTVRGGDETVLWTETLTATLPTASLRPYALQAVYPTWPGASVVGCNYIAAWTGTKRAYLASRSGVPS